MFHTSMPRREFLRHLAVVPIAAGGLALAKEKPGAKGEWPSLVTIAGKPRERGSAYGKQFKDAIAAFLDREIYGSFIQKPNPKEAMLRYADACGKSIKEFSPIIHDEMEGMAEGSGFKLEELVLITLHEELYHRGVLPKVPHCTAVAAGPPTTTGHTYVGQTWDWMQSVFGLSQMLLWKRTEGPSLLAYAFPGLWCGAGLNSAGLALCWTSAGFGDAKGANVGIPSYVLLTHLLYQDSLKAVAEEAKRNKHAGWFTFVMADGDGKLLNVEGAPGEIAVEEHRGELARVSYGSRQMQRLKDGQKPSYHERVNRMYDMMSKSKGKVDREWMQQKFADPECKICVGPSTIDMMVYDTTDRVAYLSRGSSYRVEWKEYRFK